MVDMKQLMKTAKGDVHSPLGARVTLVEAALNGSCTRLCGWVYLGFTVQRKQKNNYR